MSYATPADLLKRVYDIEHLAQRLGPRDLPPVSGELLRLSIEGADRSAYTADQISAADKSLEKINQALADGSRLADRYLSGRYLTPVATPPDDLVMHVCHWALWSLYEDKVPDAIAGKYAACMMFLKEVSKGTLRLEIPTPDSTGTGTNSAVIEHDGNVFGRDDTSFI